METNIVHIVRSDTALIHRVAEREFSGRDFFWIYLGDDVPFDLGMRKYLGQRHGVRISISGQIQSAAHEFRDEYIDAIGNLMPDKDLRSWWLSPISEKNPFVFNPFLAFCYIRSCLFHARNGNKDLLVICKTRGLSDALKKNLAEEKIPFREYDSAKARFRDRLGPVCTGIIRLGWFFGNQVVRLAASRLFALVKNDKRLLPGTAGWICIHSWTDIRSFRLDGSFRDVYFGSLGDTLEKNGNAVFYLIDVLPTAAYGNVLTKLVKSPKKVLLFENYLALPDILSALFAVRKPEIPTGRAVIGGIDIAPVLLEAQKKGFLDPRTRWSYLCYCAAKRMAARNPPGRFIYTFENHMWEKMFCSGFREAAEMTRLVGYAHTIVNRMYLNYSLSEREKGVAPLPGRIVVNGSHAVTTLVNSGFDPATIRIGGSLRYTHLPVQGENPVRTGMARTILVTTSAEANEALELIWYAMEAFGDTPDARVIVKCHPTVPYSRISRSLPSLPGNFTVSETPLDVLLKNAGLVLYTSSASAAEAFGLGVPVLHVKSEYRIDMDIFEDYPEIPSVTGAELKNAVQSSVKHDAGITGHQSPERRREILRSLFSPVDENTDKVFVSD